MNWLNPYAYSWIHSHCTFITTRKIILPLPAWVDHCDSGPALRYLHILMEHDPLSPCVWKHTTKRRQKVKGWGFKIRWAGFLVSVWELTGMQQVRAKYMNKCQFLFVLLIRHQFLFGGNIFCMSSVFSFFQLFVQWK